MDRMVLLASREATESELCAVHCRKYVRKLLYEWPQMTQEELSEEAARLDSVYLCPSSTRAATLSAGTLVDAVDQVLTGTYRNALALIRPPGHHADFNGAQGFCLVNNVAVAAQAALDRRAVERVLVVDWDVHFGNGTQQIFELDPRVLYFSVHRHDHGVYYPTLFEAQAAENVGIGPGLGTSVACGWNREYVGSHLCICVLACTRLLPSSTIMTHLFSFLTVFPPSPPSLCLLHQSSRRRRLHVRDAQRAVAHCVPILAAACHRLRGLRRCAGRPPRPLLRHARGIRPHAPRS